ncbi:MAG: SDR family oxidoreductase [Thermodesulfobacteriota bacterium]|nr:SDR family oxidoreductase [Thermodesulfobacteriota bacterium]
MDLGLKGKVAVITGGGSGIGRITAHMFADEGANVVVADVNEEGINNVAEEVKKRGVESLAIKTDVTKLEQTDNMAKSAIDKFGKIDILVHGAAYFYVVPFMKTKPDEWEKVVRVAQFGAMNTSKSVLESMMSSKSGRIIFIGSDAGRTGDPYQPVYAGAKGAIIAFLKSLAQDVGRNGITVNMVSPALVLTDENKAILTELYGLDDEKKSKRLLSSYPVRRLGTSEDISNMIVFLASEKGSFVTGQIISVNGGFCMP